MRTAAFFGIVVATISAQPMRVTAQPRSWGEHHFESRWDAKGDSGEFRDNDLWIADTGHHFRLRGLWVQPV
ncbi:hypothetical protein [Phenylobacterium montanum]|uniref:Uncharacterized protein n=1 Tax=Phenylobacterium montanum TaxID=2823693 RepID=A0A975G4G6_9CAUL|nr:hypothetical protein [Caulobacter sp. S6]QUD89861.1 hypothetical protein KCG34_08320 [Caulobacter sp. S6]